MVSISLLKAGAHLRPIPKQIARQAKDVVKGEHALGPPHLLIRPDRRPGESDDRLVYESVPLA